MLIWYYAYQKALPCYYNIGGKDTLPLGRMLHFLKLQALKLGSATLMGVKRLVL